MHEVMQSLVIILAMTKPQNELFTTMIPYVVFGGSWLLFLALSIPLLYERIKPNQLYGFRTRKTLSDENIWYKANKYMARDMIILSSLMLLYTLLVTVLPIDTEPFVVIGNLLGMIVFLPIIVIKSFMFLKKL